MLLKNLNAEFDGFSRIQNDLNNFVNTMTVRSIRFSNLWLFQYFSLINFIL